MSLLTNLHTINSDADYKDLRWKALKEFEGVKNYAYVDSHGKVTIGVGFNIEENTTIRNLVFSSLGLDLVKDSAWTVKLRDVISSAANNATPADLKTALDKILADRFKALTAEQQAVDTVKKQFLLPDDEAYMRAMFEETCDNAITGFEKKLDNLLGEHMANSNERVVLLSLMFGGLLGKYPTLVDDIQNDNRVGAWYKIRYLSNKTKEPGVTKRRYAEAQLFGLYDPIGSNGVGTAEAQKVLDMYKTNFTYIEAYEAQYGLAKSIGPVSNLISPLVAANQSLASINPANSAQSLTVDTVGQILKPVTKYLLQSTLPADIQLEMHLNDADQTAAKVAANVSGEIVVNFNTPYHGLGDYYTDNDILAIAPVYVTAYNKSPATETNLPAGITGINDVLIGSADGKNQLVGLYGNDTLIGGNECDLLVGGYASIQGDNFDSHDPRFVNSGDDKLYGLGGNDNLIGQDGNDVLEGGEGDDHLWGGVGNDLLRGGAGNDTLEGGADRDALYGGIGYDTYEFNTPYGSANNYFGGDSILDEDNNGAIFIDGNKVGTFHQTMVGGSNTYQSSYGIATLLNGSSALGGDLVIGGSVANGSYKSITIRNWRPGGLGIILDEAVTANIQELHLIPPPPPPEPPKFTNFSSPLILDLDGDGIETVSTNAGIYFDHESDGFKELTGWVAPDDGLLVLDRNGDGRITSGAELFGNNTPGSFYNSNIENGFDALKELDSNSDNAINSADNVFTQLRVWRDLNQNGASDSGELFSLSQLGVNHISLNYSTQATGDYLGNVLRQTSSFTTTDGATKTVTDVWFGADLIQRKEEVLPVSAAISALPNAEGFGTVFSLHQAMAHDQTGKLQELVTQFVNATNRQDRLALLSPILFAWTGQDSGSRITPLHTNTDWLYRYDGSGEKFDGRKLKVLAGFYGHRIPLPLAVDEASAAKVFVTTYEDIFSKLSDTLFCQLSSKTYLQDFFTGVTWAKNDSGVLFWEGDFSTVPKKLLNYAKNYPGDAQDILTDVLHSISGVSPDTNVTVGNSSVNVNAQKLHDEIISFMQTADLSVYSAEAIGLVTSLAQEAISDIVLGDEMANFLFGYDGNDILQTKGGNDFADGGIGNDSLYGSAGDDTLIGGKGNDYLYADDGGASGNNVLNGGKGNDQLHGGSGNDIYKYLLGDGNDIITDGGSANDILELGAGISQSQIITTHKFLNNVWNGKDIILILPNSETITLSDMYDSTTGNFTYSAIETIKFSDGSTWDLARIKQELLKDPSRIITGTVGNDSLLGREGNDTLIGGKGNDQLTGATGNDSYQYTLGDGNDTINDTAGNDRVELDASITQDKVIVRRSGFSKDVTLILADGGSILLKNELDASTGGVGSGSIETIQFGDGTSWDLARIRSEVLTGSVGADVLSGFDTGDIISGREGDDHIFGGASNDSLVGGQGCTGQAKPDPFR